MKKIKKIIIFYPSFENGGATKNLQNLVYFFTNKNIFIELITANAKYKDFRYQKKFFKIIKPKKIFSLFFFQRINYSFSVLKLFIQNITHIDTNNTIILSMQSHLLSVISSKFLNKKIIVRNSEDPFGATKYADERFISLIVFISKFLSFNLADGIITNSSKSLKGIKFFLFDKAKAKLIFNPYLKRTNIIHSNKNKKENILAIGRFSKQKNFSFLIDAFHDFHKKFNKYKLIIIGSGHKKKDLVNQINSLDIKKHVTLLGWKQDLTYHFRTSKFFILPSLYEGLPNILIDAINNGVPCIASNCSGASDILKNNKSGFIYQINDKKKLLKLMEEMHKNYSDYKKNSLSFIKTSDRFLVKTQAQKYLDFLLKII
jgi:GalNAc-alpha-(1->4)-GalNAc-alpha-(1->3)-diNAcBac-PP-undecaprenol alpha-1,4-N-acetyl-D-galactosaminyltransferase